MPPYERAREWLGFAARELRTAKSLIEMPEPDYRFASFACQQSAEKSIKSFLMLNNKRIHKTHDMRALADLVCEIDPALEGALEAAISLTPYAVKIRYPDANIEVTRETTLKAVSVANDVFQLFLDRIDQSL